MKPWARALLRFLHYTVGEACRRLGRIPILGPAIGVLFYALAMFAGCLLAANILNLSIHGDWKSVEELTSKSIQGPAILAVASGALAAGVALRQLRAARQARWLETVGEIQELWSAEEAVRRRRTIFESLTTHTLPNGGRFIESSSKAGFMDEDQIRAIEELCECDEEPEGRSALVRDVKSVLNDLERTALLLDYSLAPHTATIGWVSPMVIKLWLRVNLFVAYRRTVRPSERHDYYVNAERLYRSCRAWRTWRGHEPIALDEPDGERICF